MVVSSVPFLYPSAPGVPVPPVSTPVSWERSPRPPIHPRVVVGGGVCGGTLRLHTHLPLPVSPLSSTRDLGGRHLRCDWFTKGVYRFDLQFYGVRYTSPSESQRLVCFGLSRLDLLIPIQSRMDWIFRLLPDRSPFQTRPSDVIYPCGSKRDGKGVGERTYRRGAQGRPDPPRTTQREVTPTSRGVRRSVFLLLHAECLRNRSQRDTEVPDCYFRRPTEFPPPTTRGSTSRLTVKDLFYLFFHNTPGFIDTGGVHR